MNEEKKENEIKTNKVKENTKEIWELEFSKEFDEKLLKHLKFWGKIKQIFGGL